MRRKSLGGFLVLNTYLIAAFLGDALTGGEVLNKGERDTDKRKRSHAGEVAFGVVSVEERAHYYNTG